MDTRDGEAAGLETSDAPASDRAFFGHPIGLAYLLGVEVGWAFAYFGFQAMLTLYMTQSLLRPGHVEHVWGFNGYRAFLTAVYGPLTPPEVASQTFGLASGLIYALPILGGFLADRWWGQRRAMLWGVIILVAAHLLLIFEPAFLASVATMVVGTGLLKTNMLVQIGRLYAPEDDRRGRGFGLWLIALNIGSMITPLISGTLGETLGWGYGFAALAAGMGLGALCYVAGARHMPADRLRAPLKRVGAPRPAAPAGQGSVVGVLLLLMLLDAIWTGIYNQAFNVFPVWAESHVERHVFGFLTPVTWFTTLDGLMTIVGTALAVRLWSWRTSGASNAHDIRRITIGFCLAALAYLVLTGAAGLGGGGRAPLIYEVIFFVGVDFAIPWIDTTILTMVSRDAPASLTSTLLGIYYVSAAVGLVFTGWLGGLSDKMSIAKFWLTHAAIAAGCLVFLALTGGWLRRLLRRPQTASSGELTTTAFANKTGN